MKSLAQLREEKETLGVRAQAIVEIAMGEQRELTAEEKAEIDSINDAGGKLDIIQKDIDRLEKLEAKQKEIVRNRVQPRVDASGSISDEPFKVPARAVRGNLKAFKGPDAERDAYLSGQFLAATVFGNEKAKDWCKSHGVPLVNAAHSGSDNSKGGYLVPDPMEASIIRLVEEYGVARRNCRVWPMPSGNLRIPKRNGGFTSYWVGENSAITASDMAFASVELTAKKLGVLTQISNELLEDAAVAMADIVATEFAYKFAIEEDEAAFLGDGTSSYGGIVGAANALEDGALVTTASNVDTFEELTIATVHNAMGKLKRYPGIMPKWYMSQVCWSTAFERLALAAGGSTPVDYANGMGLRFQGYPVEITQVLAGTSGSTDHSGTIFAYFGDLSMAAAMGDTRGITIAADSSLYFASDAIAIRGTERLDFNIHDRGDADNAGALVGLKFNAS